jgi:hypothetical protein
MFEPLRCSEEYLHHPTKPSATRHLPNARERLTVLKTQLRVHKPQDLIIKLRVSSRSDGVPPAVEAGLVVGLDDVAGSQAEGGVCDGTGVDGGGQAEALRGDEIAQRSFMVEAEGLTRSVRFAGWICTMGGSVELKGRSASV